MAGCADDVASWLDKLGLAEYTDKFLCSGYSSLSQCVGLTKADLNAMGVVKAGHLNRLTRNLDKMKSNTGSSDSMSPTDSVSPLPSETPPLVDSKLSVPPSVPPRRTLQHKPKSDGDLLDTSSSASPPKLLPRKQSLRKSRSAKVISSVEGQKQRHSMYVVGENEELDFSSEGKLFVSRSFENLTDIPAYEPQPKSSITLPRLPPPVAPRPKSAGTRHVPTANRNGQLPTSPSSSSTATEISKESSPPPAVPIRRTSSPACLEREAAADNKPETIKAAVPPPPIMARKNTAPTILPSETINNNNNVPVVVEVEEDGDDELPPPLPIKKGSNDLSNGVIADTDVVPTQSSEEVLPASEHTSPESTPPPPLPATVTVEEASIARGLDDEHRSEGNGKSFPPPLPVKVAEVPPPPPPEEDDDSDGSPPPLPVKKELTSPLEPLSNVAVPSSNQVPVPPPPPPEEDDYSDGSPPPLPVKKELTSPLEPLSNVAVPSSNQVPVPPPPPPEDDDDEPLPPLPVKKSAQPEAPPSVLPVVSPPVEVPVNLPPENNIDADADPDLGGSKLVSEVASSKVAHVPPPVPQRRTPVIQSHAKSVDSGKDDSVVNPPPLPNRVMSVPPPPPPDASTDSESEDEKTAQRPALVSVKSQYIQDENIPLSVPKRYFDETSDSSDDEECSLGMKIISQPSVDDDTIMISSSPICDRKTVQGQPLLSNGTKDDSVINTTKLPPSVKPRAMSKKMSSPPLLSPTHNSLSKSASCDALSDLSSVYSEVGPDPTAMYSQLGPAPTSEYSQLGPAPTSEYSQVGPGPASMYSQVGPGPASMYSQVGPGPASVYSQVGPGPASVYSQVGPGPASVYSQVGPAPSTVPAQVDSVYSQLGDTVSPPPINGDLFRPSSTELPGVKEDHDGSTSSRIRSMSEAPKMAPYRKKKGGGPPKIRVTERPERLTRSHGSILSPSATRRGQKDYSHVPKTKEGWLQKRGGKHGDKPWTVRWFTFDGHELKYFKSSTDKASDCLKSVKVVDMIDVKTINDTDYKKLCRFDLVATNRVFQLASETQDEVTQWVDVLEAAIKFRPTEGEVEGGSMNNPDKQGFLQKQGHGMIKTWERRYVALKGSRFAYYDSREDFVSGKPINTLEMGLATVKPDMSNKCRFIIITTNQTKTYSFQTASDAEMREWIEALQKGIMQGLESRIGHNVVPELTSSSKEILDRLFQNPCNTTCAECSSTDPVWASVNLGIMLCINCSGVHRSMGTHISKVRSTELDQHIWTDGLIDLIVNIGNKNSNEFWEKHCQQSEKLAADVERDIRENFIRAKYELKAWIPRSSSSPPEVLGKQLCEAVKTSNIMTSLELIIRGANVNFVNMSIKGENNTPLLIAKENGQNLQMELLIQNGASTPGNDNDEESNEQVNKQGYLFKTGSERTSWRKRYCSLDKTGFKYYKSEHDSEVLGEFPVEEMLSVTISEDESSKDPHYKYCFEVATSKRPYLLCAEKDFELQQWVAAFQKIIPANAEDILGFDKIGYVYYKGPSGWKRKWCTLKRKDMCLYKRQDEKEVIDLRTAIDLKGPDTQGSFEAQCSFQIVTPGKVHGLKADNGSEADAWYSALRHTQVSGLPLQDQELTNSGIPIIVHKCLQFVESHGLESEGIYRLSGNKTRVQKLILAFNQDAKGFIVDPEIYLVNDVAGTLKQFFRSLPDPLLTHHLYAAFINAAQLTDAEERRTQIQSLVEQLPSVNRETLKRLIGHLRKVTDNANINKMSVNNIVRIFGPTLMTVDTDESTFVNANFEFCVVESMFRHYHWMFQIDENEQKKEEAMQEAMKKLELAQQMQRMHTMVDSKFLVTVFVNGKDGQSYTSKVSQVSTAGHLAEETARSKKLPPDLYALYIVLGNSEAERALHPSERVLTVMQTVQCDFFFCLKLNAFAERVRPYMSTGCDAISVNLREKKKWRKYPCTVKSSHLVLYRDNKMNHELSRTSVHEFDMFFGTMSDVKNPAPTGHQLYLKARLEEHSKYICADKEEDLLKCAGAIAHAKYPEGFPTPIIPEHPMEETPPPQPTAKARHHSEEDHHDPDIYVNVKLTKKSKTLQQEPSVDLLRELSNRFKL